MSSAEHTVKKVSEEARSELFTELSGGRTLAVEAVTKRLNETIAEVQRIIDQQERHADALKRQIIGAAEMSARNKSLEIVEDNLNKSFEEAMKKLKAASESQGYEKVLRALVLEALDQVGGESFVLHSNSRDQKTLKKIAEMVSKEKNVKISIDASPLEKTIGGVVVNSSDGYVTFDNTFEARLERLKPSLRKQIAQIFSGQQ
ncbi:MAG: hypothetical protein JRN52_05565 [Nitrososphaerota archaeon]|nr:hypothetical protein [Nitrososphaerota archaeon]